MSTTLERKVGRPSLPKEEQKHRVATYISAEIKEALEKEITKGNATTLSNAVYMILKKHFGIN